jgi:large subunit ribosomal protein L23
VRSYIQQQKLRQDKPSAKRPSPRRWFRPRAIKKMMVEMEQPFVWPAEPESFEEYVEFLVWVCFVVWGWELTKKLELKGS